MDYSNYCLAWIPIIITAKICSNLQLSHFVSSRKPATEVGTASLFLGCLKLIMAHYEIAPAVALITGQA